MTTFGIGPQFIDAWKNKGIEDLTEIQKVALTDPSLRQGQNALIVAPTSSGKTFIGEVLAVRAASTLHRAIYLVPYKALADEKYLEFYETYGDLGISIVVSSGDHAEFDAEIRRGDFGIAVIVYEKLALLLVQSPGIISDCHLVVVDEAQLIRDRDRGALLELLLTKIKRLDPSPQIVCLSATVSDLGGFDSWLQAKVIEAKDRPVPLWEGVVEGFKRVNLHNVADNHAKTSDFGVAASVENHETVLEELVKHLPPEEQMLIFRTQVDATERTAARLAQVVAHRPVPSDVQDHIMTLEDSPLRSFLEKHIERRIAYHNAGLSPEERRLVEALFREGILQVIVTTTTLAAGVNLPADKVVIADFKRYDPLRRTQVAIDVAEYRNCAGRAGRYGKRAAGTSLLLAEKTGQTQILENEYIFGNPPKLDSAIPMRPDFARHVLGVIAEQLADTKFEIIELFRESFAFASFYQPGGYETLMVEAIDSEIKLLLELGLVEEEDDRFKITPLGRVAARSGVSIETFGVLESFVSNNSMDTLSVQDIFHAIADVSEMKPLRPFSAAQRAELLTRWVQGESAIILTRNYSQQYSLGYGRIKNLGEVAEWLLSTAAQIGTTIGAKSQDIERLIRLAQEAHFGVPMELVELSRLRVIQRSDLLRLINNEKGIRLTEPHKILDADPGLFTDIMAPQKVIALKEGIARSICDTLKRRKVGHLIRCDKLAAIRPLVERVYDTHGTDFDRALENFLNAPMVELGVRRFTRQPSGQPDLELRGMRGTIVISATASQNDQKPVAWDKCREVLGSVGYSGTASNFVVIGKPHFHKSAIDNVRELASKDTNLLLVPVDVVVELCLRKVEGRLSGQGLISELEDTHGILNREDLEYQP